MKDKVKILFIVQSLKNHSPIKGLLALIKGIRHLFNIHIIYLEPMCDDYIFDKLVNLEVKFLSSNSPGFRGILKAIRFINSYILANKIDVAISMLLRPDIVLSLLEENVVKISSVRDMTEYQYQNDYGKILGSFFSAIHFSTLKKIGKIIVMSDEMKKYLLRKDISTEDKIFIVYNFIDEEELNIMKNIQINFPFNNGKKTVVTSSLLIRRKNLKFMIETLLELMKEGLEFNVLILGDGYLRKSLESMVNSSKFSNLFFFTGHVDNPYPYLKKSDIFLMTSLSEGVSRALMEALYLGKICIASDIFGNHELIQNGINGYIYKDKEELKNLLKENIHKNNSATDILLPDKFRYHLNIDRFVNLINMLNI